MNNLAGSLKPPKHLLTLQKAQELFEPYKVLLAECIQYGWDQWASFYKPKHSVLNPRARANIVYSEIVAKVAEKFHGLPGVVFKPFRSFFLLYIGDQISVRFKKFNRHGRCSSVRTRQQYLFNMQMEIPGMEKGTMFNAGYALDEVQQNVVKKAIVCEFGNRVLYQINLLADVNAAIELTPAPQPQTPPETQKSRFEINPQTEPGTEQVKKRKRKGA
jgi:hypothetical protein